ncbi:uncharacterized protein CLUP02_10862 [Colletotrichum lupini]|uniref:Uncharacterized protein n=1 Tax=Colletotrichum lupini TaxID=145971 RepID=A0A9Q8SXR6_9PEZI|nr:uncharacterized protein CLUP02_10862 [Colletotrichum lupini]UQC85365.1 hypothetical protein CLUP02_10862 [Colletotrichum lupini]
MQVEAGTATTPAQEFRMFLFPLSSLAKSQGRDRRRGGGGGGRLLCGYSPLQCSSSESTQYYHNTAKSHQPCSVCLPMPLPGVKPKDKHTYPYPGPALAYFADGTGPDGTLSTETIDGGKDEGGTEGNKHIMYSVPYGYHESQEHEHTLACSSSSAAEQPVCFVYFDFSFSLSSSSSPICFQSSFPVPLCVSLSRLVSSGLSFLSAPHIIVVIVPFSNSCASPRINISNPQLTGQQNRQKLPLPTPARLIPQTWTSKRCTARDRHAAEHCTTTPHHTAPHFIPTGRHCISILLPTPSALAVAPVALLSRLDSTRLDFQSLFPPILPALRLALHLRHAEITIQIDPFSSIPARPFQSYLDLDANSSKNPHPRN